MTDSAIIDSLHCWPVKGLSGQRLERMELRAHEPYAHDRLWAIERAGPLFDPESPRHIPKGKFFQLVNTPKLAAVKSRYEPESARLTLLHEGREVASGALNTEEGRRAIEDFLADWLGDLAPQRPRVVGIGAHHFFDVPKPYVSLINLETLAALGELTGRPLERERERFRANIYVRDLPAWAEADWEGREVLLNGRPAFIARERIGRCVATEVNPATGERDVVIPRTMLQELGHKDCALYLEPIADVTLAPGDALRVAE
jgi:uncharacterized protein YcbX